MPSESATAAGEPISRASLARPRSLLPLLVIFAGSRTLGLVREVGLAYYFGTSIDADRFSAAFATAAIAAMLLGEAVYAGTIREVSLRTASAAARRVEVFRELLPTIVRAACAAALLFAVLGPALATFALGRSAEIGEVTPIVVVLTIAVACVAISGAFNALLTLQGRLALQNGVQAMYSTGALVALGSFALGAIEPSPLAVAIGWSMGNLAAVAVLCVVVGILPHRRRADSPAALAVLRPGAPIALSYALIALQLLIAQTIAGRLGTGNLAALAYADRLFLLPIGFVLAALGPMVLGALSGVDRSDVAALATLALSQLRTCLGLVIPGGLLLAAVAPALVKVVFDYGAFDAASLMATRAALDGLAMGAIAVALTLICLRMMQVVLEPRALVEVSAISALVFAALGSAFAAGFDLVGVTAAWSVTAVLLLVVQLRRLGGRLGREWFRRAMRFVLAPALVGIAICGSLVVLHRNGVISAEARALMLALAAGLAAVLLHRPAGNRG